ncbi:MAG: hypothetical protein U1E57_01495 [Paenacidovorax caeni]
MERALWCWRLSEQRNAAQQRVLFERIRAHREGQLQGKVIALWGWPSRLMPTICVQPPAAP